jgi:hypothetical protein
MDPSDSPLAQPAAATPGEERNGDGNRHHGDYDCGDRGRGRQDREQK